MSPLQTCRTRALQLSDAYAPQKYTKTQALSPKGQNLSFFVQRQTESHQRNTLPSMHNKQDKMALNWERMQLASKIMRDSNKMGMDFAQARLLLPRICKLEVGVSF